MSTLSQDKEIHQASFDDLERLGFLHAASGNIFIYAHLFQAQFTSQMHNSIESLGEGQGVALHVNLVSCPRLRRFFVNSCQGTVARPYSLVWVHARATYWDNCPSIRWLWQAYERSGRPESEQACCSPVRTDHPAVIFSRLPSGFRSNLENVYVVHCDLPLWACASLVLPWMSGLLWRKVVWVSRVEFLWDHIPKAGLEVGGGQAILIFNCSRLPPLRCRCQHTCSSMMPSWRTSLLRTTASQPIRRWSERQKRRPCENQSIR